MSCRNMYNCIPSSHDGSWLKRPENNGICQSSIAYEDHPKSMVAFDLIIVDDRFWEGYLLRKLSVARTLVEPKTSWRRTKPDEKGPKPGAAAAAKILRGAETCRPERVNKAILVGCTKSRSRCSWWQVGQQVVDSVPTIRKPDAKQDDNIRLNLQIQLRRVDDLNQIGEATTEKVL